jgi:hypothetical protein
LETATCQIEFEEDTSMVLEKVQATTRLIPREIDVRLEYGISWLTWRGVMAHMGNIEVPAELVNVVNCLCAESNSTTGTQDWIWQMCGYTTLKALFPTTLYYSCSL